MLDNLTGPLRTALRETLRKQIEGDDPPETRATFDRLRAAGMPEPEVWRLLSAVLLMEMAAIAREAREFDRSAYAQALVALPELPVDGHDGAAV